jgi:rod shape determining protein RodA
MFKNLNWKLIIIVVILFIIGEFAIYSASSIRQDAMSVVARQGLWMLIGIGAIIFIMSIGYNRLIEAAYPLYIIVVILLILVVSFGSQRLGAQRWLSLGFLNIQPSELAKFVLILTLTRFFGFEKQRLNQFSFILVSIAILSFLFVLVLKQPDLGTALSFIPIFLAIVYVGGMSYRFLIGLFVTGIISSPILWRILRDYQKKRLLVFLNPDIDPLGAGYTIIQSKIAIGSGGLFGKGYLMGTQSQLKFLPEAHTDFIFAVIAEEWGFIGAFLVMFLFFLLVIEGFNIAYRCKNNQSRLLATGIATMLAFHFLINVSMIIGLVPVVGLPLPFISYGGSNLIVSLVGIGILLSIDREMKT